MIKLIPNSRAKVKEYKHESIKLRIYFYVLNNVLTNDRLMMNSLMKINIFQENWYSNPKGSATKRFARLN